MDSVVFSVQSLVSRDLVMDLTRDPHFVLVSSYFLPMCSRVFAGGDWLRATVPTKPRARFWLLLCCQTPSAREVYFPTDEGGPRTTVRQVSVHTAGRETQNNKHA